MAKYDPLQKYLENEYSNGIKERLLSFKDIEGIIGVEMEPSAYRYFRSWDNTGGQSYVRQNSWLDADWETVMVDMEGELVKFKHVMRL